MSHDDYDEALAQLRRICLGFPETSERLSHGEPTFFVPPYVGHRGYWPYAI